MKRLTDTQLKAYEKAPPPRRVDIPDGQEPGLMLRVTPRGTRTWSYQYRITGLGGVTHRGHQLKGPPKFRVTVGQYPKVSISEARKIAAEYRAMAEGGEDPRHHLEAQATARRHTVEALAQEFLVRHVRGNSLRSYGKFESALRVHVLPHWAKRSAASVMRGDAVALLEAIPGIEARRTTRNILHKMFDWASKQGFCDANPVSGIELPPAKHRDRVLSMDELRAAWHASGQLGYPFGPMYRLILLSACRRGEWAKARWPWINADQLCLEIPAEAYKSRRVHVVPLVERAAEVVEALPRWNAGNFMFSGTNGAKSVSGFSRAQERLGEVISAELGRELVDWRPHDFRRSVATHLRRIGTDRYVVKRLLGHADRDATAIYDRYDLLAERREALERWSAELLT